MRAGGGGVVTSRAGSGAEGARAFALPVPLTWAALEWHPLQVALARQPPVSRRNIPSWLTMPLGVYC